MTERRIDNPTINSPFAMPDRYFWFDDDQIRDAAIESARSVPPYDVLVVIGFAFDPHAWQTSKELNADTAERKVGRQRVLLTRANPDLAMGDELLKKTGAGNLFTVFGEPDVHIRAGVGEEGDQIEVEIQPPAVSTTKPSCRGQRRASSIALPAAPHRASRSRRRPDKRRVAGLQSSPSSEQTATYGTASYRGSVRLTLTKRWLQWSL